MTGYGENPSVMCFIGDGDGRSRIALEHAAHLVRRRRGRGRPVRLIAVVCTPGASYCVPGIGFDCGPMACGSLGTAPREVTALIEAVAGQHGLRIEVQEIFGSSLDAMAAAIVNGRGDAVMLPALEHDAGPLSRWLRRNLITRLNTRTRAIVIDEHGPVAAPVALPAAGLTRSPTGPAPTAGP